MEQIKKNIFKHFAGIDELRNQKKAEITKIIEQADKYNPGYIRDYVNQVKQELIKDRQERARKAKEEIEQLKQELSAKRFKGIYDDVQAQVVTPEHKLLVEMQHARKLDLLKTELAMAETPDEIKALHEQYGDYEHFSKLINFEIKKRIKDGNLDDTSKFTKLETELNQPPKEIQELTKLEHTITFIGNAEMHPVGLENGDLSNISFEELI